MPSIAALVPMRHHSQRIPGKNYRSLAGRPLYHHILASLLAVPEIAQIAVDTDSDVIMEGLRNHFPAVKIIVRPEHLRADDIPMNEVLAHDIGQLEADYYVQSHSTNPLLRPATISDAITKFLGSREEYDSLFSVTRLQTRLYDQHASYVVPAPESCTSCARSFRPPCQSNLGNARSFRQGKSPDPECKRCKVITPIVAHKD